MKYNIVTFGCRVNQADSLRIEEDLRARGGVEAASRDADLVIVNTCSVTATADQGARQTIRRIARENPNGKIVATGCYATRCEEEVAALPVVRVIRNSRKLDLVCDVLGNATTPDLKVGPTGDGEGPCGAPIEPGIAGRTAFTSCTAGSCRINPCRASVRKSGQPVSRCSARPCSVCSASTLTSVIGASGQ